MIVGGAFVYVCEKRTWERGLVFDYYQFEHGPL